MSLSGYLWGIRLFTLLSLCAWLGIVFAVDPDQTGVAGIVLFFLSFFAMLLGFFTLFMTWVYRKGLGEASAAHYLGSAFRQAVLMALYVAGLVFFQFMHVLTWWDALLLLAGVLLVEYSLRYIGAKEERT